MDPMLKNRRVLIVEDDEANQFLMQLILKRIGCSFNLVENGQEVDDNVVIAQSVEFSWADVC